MKDRKQKLINDEMERENEKLVMIMWVDVEAVKRQ